CISLSFPISYNVSYIASCTLLDAEVPPSCGSMDVIFSLLAMTTSFFPFAPSLPSPSEGSPVAQADKTAVNRNTEKTYPSLFIINLLFLTDVVLIIRFTRSHIDIFTLNIADSISPRLFLFYPWHDQFSVNVCK